MDTPRVSERKRMTKGAVACLFFLLDPTLSIWAAQNPSSAPPPPCIAEQRDSLLADSVLHPFWAASRMQAETALFQTVAGSSQATTQLIFFPTRIIKVTSADGKITFKEGRDYRLRRGTNVLELPSGSHIPFQTWEQLHPPISADSLIGEAVGGKTSLLFDRPGKLFQSLQIAVTYEHSGAWTGYIPQSAHESLPRTFTLLHSGQALKVVVLGDSISMGSGSSSDYRQVPCQPPYAKLVADGLHQLYGSPIELRNLSIGGKTATWGVQMASQVAEEKPDLVLIAFGMNDASGQRSSEAYSNDIGKIIDTVRQSSPSAEFVLVATMSGNPEWSRASPILYSQYRDTLQQRLGPGIALADMTSFSQELLRRKTFVDITANGVNHPNDFGHRIYAQVILALLR